MMPTDTGTASVIPCNDWPANTMLEAKNARYMTAAITTTISAPYEPN
jgi:hypothetical protein